MRRLPVLLLALGLVIPLFAETLGSTGLDLGYRQLYNLQFDQAQATFGQWMQLHPNDPLGPVSEAAVDLFRQMHAMRILQAQFFTQNHDFLAGPKGEPNPAFEASVRHAAELAAQAPPSDNNALYAQALCHGLRSDYLGIIEKRYLASLGEMKQGRVFAERLLARDPNYGDAYLAIGVENYILGLKPAPIRWLLRLDGATTDAAAGIRQLQMTAEHGHFLAPYARILLSIAALRAHDPEQATGLLRGLAAEFPLNPLYQQELDRLSAQVTLDPKTTDIHFELGAFLHSVHGTFELSHGQMSWDPRTGAASGELAITASTGQSGNTDRDRDMQTKVLESEKYPDIVFAPSQVQGNVSRSGDSAVTLLGTLRLHGGEHEISLPLHVHVEGGRFTATGALDIPYVAWGLKDPSNFALRVAKVVKLKFNTAGDLTWPAG